MVRPGVVFSFGENMAKYTNTTGIPLSVAVWLARDEYDHNPDPNHFSVTSLLKPTRQVVLSRRVPPSDAAVDISALVSSRMGTAFHTSIEDSWLNNYKQAMLDLGYPPGLVNSIQVNPKPEEVDPDTVQVYVEQRAFKQLGDYTISGMFDFVGDGRVEDFKSTGVFTYKNQTNNEKYAWQGSLYRWLNPEIITKDEMAIQYIFTDWSALRAKTEQGYPPSRTLEVKFPLKSLPETEAFAQRRLGELIRCMNLPDEEIPHCTDEELWRSDPVYKYYKKGVVTARSTKNFTNMAEAQTRFVEDGSVGLIVEVPGEVKACNYCAAAPICKQREALIASGSLKV